jgi:deoxyribodipyrimidine photo-lyase
MEKEKIAIFWFRRDLRWQDNVGLYHALQSGLPVLPIFIFDTDITDELPVNDARVGFIYDSLQKIHESLVEVNSSLLVLKGKPEIGLERFADKI